MRRKKKRLAQAINAEARAEAASTQPKSNAAILLRFGGWSRRAIGAVGAIPFRSICADSIRTPGSQLDGAPRSYRADKQIAVDPARFTTKNSSPKRNPAQG